MAQAVFQNKNENHHVPKRLFRTTSGVQVEYLHIDRGKERTVLFVNGWLLRLSQWSTQIPSLWDFNLLLFNNRGHGKSELARSSRKSYLTDCAADATELLSALSVHSPDIVSFSMGTAIAAEIHHFLGGNVRSMAFVSPLVGNPVKTFPIPGLLEQAIPPLRRALANDVFRTALTKLANLIKNDIALFPTYVYFKQLTGSGIEYRYFAKYLRDALDVDVRTFVTAFDSMVTNGALIRRKMAGIGCPVLVIRGQKDFFIKREAVDAIRAAIPHTQLIEFENATHYPQAERSVDFNRLLYDFLVDH